MWGHSFVALLLLVAVAEVPRHAAAGAAGRAFLQPRTKLAAQPSAVMAALAAACPQDQECPDFTMNLNYDNAKRIVSDFVASSTFQYADPTGAGGFVGGACSAQARTGSDPKPALTWTKHVPNGLKEVRAELQWATPAVCVPSSRPPPPVPSGEKLLYFGGTCEVMVFEWASTKPGQYCNNRYVGRTYAEVNYDDKLPPTATQGGKKQVWYCKDLSFTEGVCGNNCF